MNYNDRVKNALNQASNGLHLQFIDPYFRTKEVCLAAVRINKNELLSVPMGNLDYVIKELYICISSDDVKMMINREFEPLYYGEFNSYSDKLKFYKASNYDDMIRKIYEMNCA
jgi:hypothetical protein